VKIIKDFVRDKYQQSVRVTVQTDRIIIGVPGAALAGTLRMQLHELEAHCKTTKRLVLRIG
jgi:hypothetical protein